LPDESTAKPLPTIPTGKSEDALIHLRRPFTPAAMKWKVQVTGPKGKKEKTWATVVGYIDARLVYERLNMVVAGGWSEDPIRVEGNPNALLYALTVLGQRHVDVGIGQGSSEDMKIKGVHSDAIKRVAVRFGIGAYLYSMPPFNLFVTPQEEVKDDKPTLLRWKDGKAGYLKEKHETWLREEYERWLEKEGEKNFGAPLDHGDARTGSVGNLAELLVEGDGGEEEDTAPERLTDDKAQGLRQRALEAFGELEVVNPDRLARGRLDKMLHDAEHSHTELERVAVTIENVLGTEKKLADLREQLTEKIGAKEAKPLIDSAERRGSQEERIAALEKAIEGAGDGGS
jgi:hypothetical protein